jgi:O-antigen/teichoic acid export membrane protein
MFGGAKQRTDDHRGGIGSAHARLPADAVTGAAGLPPRGPQGSQHVRPTAALVTPSLSAVRPGAGLLRSSVGRNVMQTAGFNMTAMLAAGLGGVILARVLGPTMRGEYAAVTAWFGVACSIGDIGQPAALCFFVARDPNHAPDYVATSRAMMLAMGALTVGPGMLLAPLLARGNPGLTLGYRIAFGTLLVALVGGSYAAALQPRDMRNWNVTRASQPVLGLIAIISLGLVGRLTLNAALVVIAVTAMLQLVWAYRSCRHTGLAPGHARIRLARPLATFGMVQLAATAPILVNARLDQLVLSQAVPPADLGRYAVAVSLTMLPMPAVTAIGNVAFPWLASRVEVTATTHRAQRIAVQASFALAVGILVPFAVAARWLVPLVFGSAYRGAVPLLWILTPGAVFLACARVTGDLLRGRNRPAMVARAEGLAAVATVLLLLLLLPVIGVAGAAVASTVAYGVAFAAMLRLLWRLPDSSDRSRGGGRHAAPARRAGLRPRSRLLRTQVSVTHALKDD